MTLVEFPWTSEDDDERSRLPMASGIFFSDVLLAEWLLGERRLDVLRCRRLEEIERTPEKKDQKKDQKDRLEGGLRKESGKRIGPGKGPGLTEIREARDHISGLRDDRYPLRVTVIYGGT